MSLFSINLQHFPKIFYWLRIRRLARPLDDSDIEPLEPRGRFAVMCVQVCCLVETPNVFHAESSDGDAKVIFLNFALILIIIHFMMCRSPVPVDEKRSQIMILPPPCFTVGIVVSGL